MKLVFVGHDRRYAAEQALLTLFPGERPVYDGEAGAGGEARLTLRRGAAYTVSVCTLTRDGRRYRGEARERNPAPADKAARDRVENRLVKTAFYRAALASGVPEPPWGSLTGVRPAKLLTGFLERGLPERAAVSAFRREYGVSEKRAALCLAAARAALDAKASLAPRDVCLYVGIPFCPTRCAYCSFVSQSVEKSMTLIEPFLAALFLEIGWTAEAARAAGLRPTALYMGGGTPTTLSADQLDALCARLETAFDLSALREYTVEAGRPDTITDRKLRVLRDHGVTRVSVNPQTMADSVLAAIGRRHTAADILRALDLVRAAGDFDVNMDLIAGLPTDTARGFDRTLDAVLALAPENVTVHTLARKRGARLDPADSRLPGAETVGEMLDAANAALTAGGWAPYYLYRQKFMSGGFENVGWAKPGTENLYNICMMEELCGILAMGAGGATKLTGGGGRIVRLCAPKYPKEYMDGAERLRQDKKRIGEFYGIRPEGNKL